MNLAQMLAAIERNKDTTERFAKELAENSILTVADTTNMLNMGDVTFTAEQAAYLGFVDRVKGKTIDAIDQALLNITTCDKLELLSICD